MEGNDCYKFSTIKNYLEKIGGQPIRLAADIGCNIGEVTAIMRRYFPGALIFAFEPVPEYFHHACETLKCDSMVKVLPIAVTAEHRFADDLGVVVSDHATPLRILRALPTSGPGWKGGSHVLRDGEQLDPKSYELLNNDVNAITLDELVTGICTLCNATQIDYLKFDCEGCENSSLGCAFEATLRRIRFISGEYHNIDRFRKIISDRLLTTHDVHLSGESWGAFFAERKGHMPSILIPSGTSIEDAARYPRNRERPALTIFNEDYVLPDERTAHGL